MRSIALAALVAAAAGADAPPPRGTAEECQIERVKKQGDECETVRVHRGGREREQRDLGDKGYTLRCRTGGAAEWTEIWCKPGKDSDPEPG